MPDDVLLVGNDASLSGLAEARRGAGAGAWVVLHLTVEVGVGGVLVVDGVPVAGRTGTGGEFGHIPLGDPALRCPCVPREFVISEGSVRSNSRTGSHE